MTRAEGWAPFFNPMAAILSLAAVSRDGSSMICWSRREKQRRLRAYQPNPERVIGTLRRECLDHMIVLNERHLRHVLDEFIEEYYNPVRPHLSLDRNSPIPRKSDPPANGRVVSAPILRGLHHRYHRVA